MMCLFARVLGLYALNEPIQVLYAFLPTKAYHLRRSCLALL